MMWESAKTKSPAGNRRLMNPRQQTQKLYFINNLLWVFLLLSDPQFQKVDMVL